MPRFWDSRWEGYGNEGNWSRFPAQLKARQVEAAPVRVVRASAYLRGGHRADDGDTSHDVTALRLRLGFDTVQGDSPLAHANCTLQIPASTLSRDPKVGDLIVVEIGCDEANRLIVFRGQVEDAKKVNRSTAWSLSCFDQIRRLRDYPFQFPPSQTDIDGGYTAVTKADTETGLPQSVQEQIVDLLSAADVMAHSPIGVDQYPAIENDRPSLYDELADLLRSAQCRAYMGASGRLVIAQTDDSYAWVTLVNSDLTRRRLLGLAPGIPDATTHVPLVHARGLYPQSVIAHSQALYGGTSFPDRELPDDLPVDPFQFNAHNVISISAIDSTLVVNEVKSRTTPEASLRDFIDLSGLSFEDMELIQFSQIGDGSTADSEGTSSVSEYGLRSRSWSLGGLHEVPRASLISHTGPTPQTVKHGRYALDKFSFSDAQLRARQFPSQRLMLTSPGILSVQPFEIVEVNLPDHGLQGYFMVEGRKLDLGSGGFVSTDTMRRVDVQAEFVTLDVRD